MAQSFYPNVTVIGTRALTDIGVVDPEGGLVPSTTQLNDVMQVMNFIATAWISYGMQVWCQKTGTYALSNGVYNPTIGPAGVINQARPEAITQAWLRDTTQTNPIDIPVQIGSREDYNRLTQKTATGTPNMLFYDPQYDVPSSNSGASAKGQIFLWPVPDTATAAQYDLYFIYTRPLQDFSTLSDALDFPQEWYEPIRWAIAESLCPSYNVPVMKWDRIRAKAKETLDLASSFDRETTSVTISPAVDPMRMGNA